MRKLWPALGLALLLMPQSWAYDTKPVVTGHELPTELKNVGVDEHLGANLDLGLQFTDESGETVPLGKYFGGHKPVLMAMVYYTCPSLCNYHLNGLTDTMKTLKLTSGQDFEVVAVSMNSKETPDVAAKKKHNYLEVYGRPQGEKGWHFLVGNEENVQKLASQLGFKFHWMEDKQQYAHAAVAYVVTPEGKISRYLHGIQVDPKTLRLSLLEASNGKIGGFLEQAVMFCFQFDPQKNKYTLYAWNIMRVGAFMMLVLLAIIFIPVWWRAQKHQSPRT